MLWNKRFTTALCLLACLALAFAPQCAFAAEYVPTNRDTRMEGASIEIAEVDLRAYALLYESDECQYYFRDDRDVIAIRDKRSGYVWKTGLDAGFSSDIKKAVKNAKTDEELLIAAEPMEKSLNSRYIGIANSLLTATYYESETIKYISSAAEDDAASTLTPMNAPGVFALDVEFTKLDLFVRVVITFGAHSIHYSIAFDDMRGAGLSQLSSLWITPFFGASGGEAEYYDFEKGDYGDVQKKPAPSGYVFVPDGSGGLIRFLDNSVAFTEYVGDVYGPDPATHTYYYSGGSDAVEVKHPVMPVFGIAHGNRQAAFVAYAESGAEHMTVFARPEENMRIKYTWAHPSFEYNNTYYRVYNRYGDGYFTLMSEPYDYDISITYELLAGADADWAGMARTYREHLIETGALTERNMESALPLRVDFILSDIKKGLVGNEQVVVTTLSDVRALLTEIAESGVPNITSGLKGWQRGAEVTAKPDAYKFASGVGSAREYEALARDMAALGASLTLARDVSRINESMVRFKGTAAQHVNTWYVIKHAGALYQNAPIIVFGVATPEKSADWIRALAEDIKKTGGGLTLTGVTNTLTSTFDRHGAVTSVTDAIRLYADAVSRANVPVDMDRPNLYLWKAMRGYLNAPVMCSQYIFETDTVPFLEMVLNGTCEAYAPYCNFSNYTRTDQLRIIDYNLSPAFVLSMQPSYLLADTLSSDLYSTEASEYMGLIKEVYAFVSSALNNVRGYEWVGRDVPMDGVAVNRYEKDGQTAVVIVNYTGEDVTVGGVRVGARNYAFALGGEAE